MQLRMQGWHHFRMEEARPKGGKNVATNKDLAYSKGPSTLQCESNQIQILFELIWINPDRSGLGHFSTSLSLLETNRFRDIIH